MRLGQCVHCGQELWGGGRGRQGVAAGCGAVRAGVARRRRAAASGKSQRHSARRARFAGRARALPALRASCCASSPCRARRSAAGCWRCLPACVRARAAPRWRRRARAAAPASCCPCPPGPPRGARAPFALARRRGAGTCVAAVPCCLPGASGARAPAQPSARAALPAGAREGPGGPAAARGGPAAVYAARALGVFCGASERQRCSVAGGVPWRGLGAPAGGGARGLLHVLVCPPGAAAAALARAPLPGARTAAQLLRALPG